MELKNTEKQVADLQDLYSSVRTIVHLPELGISSLEGEEEASNNDNALTNKQILQAIESLCNGMTAVEQKIERFRKRRLDKDPVTGKPRYGENTMKRVEKLLVAYDELQKYAKVLSGDSTVEDSDANILAAVEKVKQEAIREDIESEESKKAREEQRLRDEEAAQKQRQAQELQRQQMLEAERQQREREEVERLAQLRSVLDAERQANEAAANADREWVANIGKGKEAVQKQLQILIDSTANDPAAQKDAINALHTLFSQIVAHPEEPNFRRIRRDHPRFTQDIGRHAGGREILIAAGFTLGLVDEVPSYVSKEPNVEKDLDGWSDWFDLNKAALELVEEQLINIA